MAGNARSRGAELRLLPGDLCLVRYAADPSLSHERVALWPVSNREWAVLTPKGDVLLETFAGFERVVKITGRDQYPDEVEKVTAFEVPLELADLQYRIAVGRKEARASRQSRNLSLEGLEPTSAVDGWSGEAIVLPAETMVQRLANRVTGKRAPPDVGEGVVTVGPKVPLLPLAAEPPRGGPDPKKLFGVQDVDDLLPRDGLAWVVVDPFRSDKYCLGTTVDLPEGSVVRGNDGLMRLSDKVFIPVRQIAIGWTPGLLGQAITNLRLLRSEEVSEFPEAKPPDDPALPPPAEGPDKVAEQAAMIRDLRERLAVANTPRVSETGGEPWKDKGAPARPAGEKDLDDIRTLSVDYDDHGERFKRWREFSREVHFTKFPDWPFEDSSSQSLHLIKHWDKHAEDGLAWLNKWLADRGVSPNERTGIEMKCLITCLHLAGTYDHLNVPVLACLETIGRRIAQIVEAYSIDSRQPRWQGVHLYQGTTDAMAAIDPNLKASVVRKRKEELEVANLSNKVLGGNDHGGIGGALPAPHGGDDDGPGGQGKGPKKKPKKPLAAPGGKP